jgi:hypothetical protein
MDQMVWFLFGLGLGLALDWMLVKVMLKSLKERVKALELSKAQDLVQESDLESDLAQESARQWAERNRWVE